MVVSCCCFQAAIGQYWLPQHNFRQMERHAKDQKTNNITTDRVLSVLFKCIWEPVLLIVRVNVSHTFGHSSSNLKSLPSGKQFTLTMTTVGCLLGDKTFSFLFVFTIILLVAAVNMF